MCAVELAVVVEAGESVEFVEVAESELGVELGAETAGPAGAAAESDRRLSNNWQANFRQHPLLLPQLPPHWPQHPYSCRLRPWEHESFAV